MAIIGGKIDTGTGTYITGNEYVEVSEADLVISDTDLYRFIFVTCGSANRTVTLPTVADNDGRLITIKKVDSGSGALIIDGEGSETVEGRTTITICNQYGETTLQAVNGKWLEVVTNGESYGEMYQNDNSTATTVSAQDTWYEIGNYSEGENCNTSFGSSAMTVGTGGGGTYQVAAVISGVPETPNDVFEFAFSVNDVISTKTKASRKFSSGTDAGCVMLNGILVLADADVIKVELQNLSGGGDFTVQNSNVTIHRIV